MKKKDDKSLDDALTYISNLPKHYVKELELNEDIFFEIIGYICDMASDGESDPDAPGYMPLQYETAQKYCLQGFPKKYVYDYYSEYCRTINASILVYYKIFRNDESDVNNEEYNKMFAYPFLDERNIRALNEDEICDIFDKEEKIKEEKLAGYRQKKFEENWKKKYSYLLSEQIKNGDIILRSFYPREEYDKLISEGTTLKRAINFLDKLEDEGHESDSDNVLIPYKEYHALHELLSKKPKVKIDLEKKHREIVKKIWRIVNKKAKRTPEV